MEPDAVQLHACTATFRLSEVLSDIQKGTRDPTTRIEGNSVRRAFRTPDGPGTLELSQADSSITARAWGEGAQWLIARSRPMTGLEDRPEDFRTDDRRVLGWLARFPHIRLARTPMVFDAVVTAIYGQRVTSREAVIAHRRIISYHKENAPGPFGLTLPSSRASLMKLSYEQYADAGVDRRRARTLREVAARWRLLTDVTTRAELDRVLQDVPGIGPWTLGSAGFDALGDPDSVPFGDYHLPHLVGYAFLGKARSSDAEMERLLEPFSGHRGRVIRLLYRAGFSSPRFGPRYAGSPRFR